MAAHFINADKSMLTANAVVPTDGANRHLTQLCRHAAKMRESRHLQMGSHDSGHMPPKMQRVECTDTQAIFTVEGGRCVIEATHVALTLRVEAADQNSLRRIQELVAHRVETIGSREGLKVSWQTPGR